MEEYTEQREITNGLVIDRKFTKEDTSVYDMFNYDLRSSMIRNPDGSVVFEMKDVEVPDFYSQIATDILAQNILESEEFRQKMKWAIPSWVLNQVSNKL